jgi:hypothetical protein
MVFYPNRYVILTPAIRLLLEIYHTISSPQWAGELIWLFHVFFLHDETHFSYTFSCILDPKKPY